ncbi:hypothetical protein HDV01_002399 [Terramyces sp. JEL0728]|nr:hypothetical protein HDV01_002399 [Terramyces sp. JEL0728]
MLSIIPFISAAAGYSLCDKANYPYAGQSVTVTLVPTISEISLNDQSIFTQVSGSITIVDGCNFKLSDDFTMNPLLSCIWAGGKINGPKSGSDGITLSKAAVTSASAGKVFPFVSTSGNFVSYKDFTQFRLFSQASGVVIATADITYSSSVRVVGSVQNTTAATSTLSASNTGTATNTTTNSAIQQNSWLFLLSFLSLCIM